MNRDDHLLGRLRTLDPARGYTQPADTRDAILSEILRGSPRDESGGQQRLGIVNGASARAHRGLRRAAAATLASLVVAGAVQVVASTGGGPPSLPFPSARTPEPVASVDPELSARYAIFRQGQTRADMAPRRLETYDALLSGANPQLARRVAAGPHDDVYLAPSRQGACLLSSAGTEDGCFTVALLLAGNAVSAVECAPGMAANTVEVYGLLPDGATATAIRFANGARTTVPLSRNYYAYTASTTAPLPTSIEWTLAGTNHQTAANVPAGTPNCAPQPPGTVPLYLHPGGPVTHETTPR